MKQRFLARFEFINLCFTGHLPRSRADRDLREVVADVPVDQGVCYRPGRTVDGLGLDFEGPESTPEDWVVQLCTSTRALSGLNQYHIPHSVGLEALAAGWGGTSSCANATAGTMTSKNTNASRTILVRFIGYSLYR